VEPERARGWVGLGGLVHQLAREARGFDYQPGRPGKC
jgi:hypothetical protein